MTQDLQRTIDRTQAQSDLLHLEATRAAEIVSGHGPEDTRLSTTPKDNGMLCPDCANGKNGSDAAESNDDPQWQLVAADVHWEGEAMICDHCNAEIESAYGPIEENQP